MPDRLLCVLCSTVAEASQVSSDRIQLMSWKQASEHRLLRIVSASNSSRLRHASRRYSVTTGTVGCSEVLLSLGALQDTWAEILQQAGGIFQCGLPNDSNTGLKCVRSHALESEAFLHNPVLAIRTNLAHSKNPESLPQHIALCVIRCLSLGKFIYHLRILCSLKLGSKT